MNQVDVAMFLVQLELDGVLEQYCDSNQAFYKLKVGDKFLVSNSQKDIVKTAIKNGYKYHKLEFNNELVDEWFKKNNENFNDYK